jgi:hypothetical protein
MQKFTFSGTYSILKGLGHEMNNFYKAFSIKLMPFYMRKRFLNFYAAFLKRIENLKFLLASLKTFTILSSVVAILCLDFSAIGRFSPVYTVHILAGFRNNFQGPRRLPVSILRVELPLKRLAEIYLKIVSNFTEARRNLSFFHQKVYKNLFLIIRANPKSTDLIF